MTITVFTASLLLALFVRRINCVAPITISGTKFFQGDQQFYIKGVAYTQNSGSQSISPGDVLANGDQCKLDAPLLKSLGVNTVRVYWVDPTQDHEDCMYAFGNYSIYVLVDLEAYFTDVMPWNQSHYNRQTDALDSFAGYENLLGVSVGNDAVRDVASTVYAADIKAAASDIKAYRDAKGYRQIPVGYMNNVQFYAELAEYLVCGGSSSNTIDFFGLEAFSWCGNSSYTTSDYSEYTENLSNLNVPIFFAETGCNTVEPRTFTDQVAIFGPNMNSVFSGAIVYEWLEEGNEYGLVSYTSELISGTATPLAGYSNLQSQWSTLDPTGVQRTAYTFQGTTPACPTTNTAWLLAADAVLPTVAVQLNTISPLSSSAAVASTKVTTGTASSSGASAHPEPSSTTSDSGLSRGAKIGIGVAVPLAVITASAISFLLLLRRRRRFSGLQSQEPEPEPDTDGSGSFNDKPELSAGPIDPAISGPVKPKSELQGSKTTQRRSFPAGLDQAQGSYATQNDDATANTPSNLDIAGRAVPELHSQMILEAGPGTVPEKTMSRLPIGVNAQNVASSSSTPTVLGSSAEPTQLSSLETELIEEADAAVQELGFITMRKRALLTQANAVGKPPAEVEGRKGEEYRELLERETKLRSRLDQIEAERKEVAR